MLSKSTKLDLRIKLPIEKVPQKGSTSLSAKEVSTSQVKKK